MKRLGIRLVAAAALLTHFMFCTGCSPWMQGDPQGPYLVRGRDVPEEVYVAHLMRQVLIFFPGDHYLLSAADINTKRYEMTRERRIGLMRRPLQNKDGSYSDVIDTLDPGCLLANTHEVTSADERGEFGLVSIDPFLLARIDGADAIDRRSQRYPAKWIDRSVVLHVVQGNADGLRVTELLGLDRRGRALRRASELRGSWRDILNEGEIDALLEELRRVRTSEVERDF